MLSCFLCFVNKEKSIKFVSGKVRDLVGDEGVHFDPNILYESKTYFKSNEGEKEVKNTIRLELTQCWSLFMLWKVYVNCIDIELSY